ncbi:hypothetical protein D3C81_1742760 [compost metagenome]
MTGTNQQGANDPKAIHKTCPDHEQVWAPLDHFLCILNFCPMTREATENVAAVTTTKQIQQLIANHSPQRDRDNNQRKFE